MTLDLIAVAVVAGFGCWQWYIEGPNGLSITALALATVLLVIVLSALYFVPLMAYRRDEKLKRPYHLRFADAGIEFRTDNLESRLDWQLYSRVLIDRDSYLLYHGNAQFTISPKHAVRDESSRREFEQLLQDKIPVIVRRS